MELAIFYYVLNYSKVDFDAQFSMQTISFLLSGVSLILLHTLSTCICKIITVVENQARSELSLFHELNHWLKKLVLASIQVLASNLELHNVF